MKLMARDDLRAPALADLVQLDDDGFRAFFSASPVKRIGHARFLRNVLIAIGNSGDPDLLPLAEARLADPDPLIRGAAVWAVRRLAADAHADALRLAFLPDEGDISVQAEWSAAVQPARAN
jgi:epoxyqueuosine reductase